MSPHHRAILSSPVESRTPPSTELPKFERAIFKEMSFVRREAKAEANFAYEGWLIRPDTDRYIVYRAAQDRADAAQDDLAEIARLLDESAA